jgi:hypothetical protein
MTDFQLHIPYVWNLPILWTRANNLHCTSTLAFVRKVNRSNLFLRRYWQTPARRWPIARPHRLPAAWRPDRPAPCTKRSPDVLCQGALPAQHSWWGAGISGLDFQQQAGDDYQVTPRQVGRPSRSLLIHTPGKIIVLRDELLREVRGIVFATLQVVTEECNCEMRHALRIWGIQHGTVG